MQPQEPSDDDLKAPEGLVKALGELHRERIFVPAAVDAAILRRARQRTRRPAGWLAAAAALIAAAWLGWMQFGSGPVRHDVNGDGRMDMRDALALARRVSSGDGPVEWDVNRDGKTDARDAEMLAREAVKLIGGGAS